jgi:hypothetical protein
VKSRPTTLRVLRVDGGFWFRDEAAIPRAPGDGYMLEKRGGMRECKSCVLLVRAQQMIEGEKEFLTVFERGDYTRAVFLSKSNYCRKNSIRLFPRHDSPAREHEGLSGLNTLKI